MLFSFATPSTAMVGTHSALAAASDTGAMIAYSVTGSVPSVDVRSATALLTTPKYDRALDSVQIRRVRILTQVRTHREFFQLNPDIRFTLSLKPTQRKILHRGVNGIRVVSERVTTWDSTVVDRQVLTRAILRKPQRGVILAGVPTSPVQFPVGLRYRRVAALITMVATAYTAGSASPWSSGYTATGVLARYGVVAVDPRIIPLGSHLFIPGYGFAIAADTGGAIIGNRVDLCMDSLVDALNFGRHIVRVYILRQ